MALPHGGPYAITTCFQDPSSVYLPGTLVPGPREPCEEASGTPYILAPATGAAGAVDGPLFAQHRPYA